MSHKSVLFVCLGNTCRSPMAEACLKELLAQRGTQENWQVDSAGTSNSRVRSSPNPVAQECMRLHGILHHVQDHKSRQVATSDFETFNFIFAMDQYNMDSLMSLAPEDAKSKIKYLASFDSDCTLGEIISDPYGGSLEDYEAVFACCWRSCENFLDSQLNDYQS